MTLLAVSFCNQPGPDDPGIAILDVEREERRLLTIAPGEVSSVCGLAADDRHLFCAYSYGDRSAVAVLDRVDYRLVDTIPLPAVRDVHSMLLDGAGLIVASTGTDEIVRFEGGCYETLWRAAPGAGDTHHVNSLAWVDGQLCCTAFGPNDGQSWDDSVDGYAYDVGAGRRIVDGLYQPHSLCAAGSQLYLCDSARSALRTIAADIRFVDGYARGLAIADDGRYYVGSSIGRRAPRTLAAVGNAAFPGAREGSCAIEAGNPDKIRPELRIDFDGIASEIYDVLLIG